MMAGDHAKKNGRKTRLPLVLLLPLCLLTACSCWAAVPDGTPEPESSAVTAEAVVPELPGEPEAVPDVPEKEPWAPVEEAAPVDDSYFDDVAFVGDSRTDGFRLYSGLERGMYFYVTGETVASATELQNWTTEGGEKISLADAVAAADCGKIYLMMGVNELGWSGTEIFRGHAENLLQRLMTDHPETEIVIQSLLPVTAEQDAKKTYVNNQRILAYNQVWLELAEQYDCNYVNVAEALTDGDGCLPKDLSYDGVHLNKAGCRLWLDYLRTHSVGDAAQVEAPPSHEEAALPIAEAENMEDTTAADSTCLPLFFWATDAPPASCIRCRCLNVCIINVPHICGIPQIRGKTVAKRRSFRCVKIEKREGK